jgi:DNA-binding transcriptional regulator YdaS (Cro superfamily)
MTNENINRIIDLFGGGSAMAKALDTYPSLVSQWKVRKSIPKSWWISIATAAEAKGIELTLDDIMKADLT